MYKRNEEFIQLLQKIQQQRFAFRLTHLYKYKFSANLLHVQMNKCGFYVPEQYPNYPNRCVFQYLKLDGSFSND